MRNRYHNKEGVRSNGLKKPGAVANRLLIDDDRILPI